jgi:hypothetical protein
MVVVDMAGATSTGILGLPTLLLFSSYIKYKSNKTSSNRRGLGEVENWSRSLRFSGFHIHPSCEQLLPRAAEAIVIRGPFLGFYPVSHSFHNHCTVCAEEEQMEAWINRGKPLSMRPIAQSVY